MTGFLRPLHPLTNFEMQMYYQDDEQLNLNNELKFNGVYSNKGWGICNNS